MALVTASDWQNVTNMILYYLEITTGKSVGELTTSPEYTSTSTFVQVSPWVYEMLVYGYNPQDVTNYGPSTDYQDSDGKVIQAWPEGQSPTEAADQADLTTVITGYLTYKNTRLSNDTNNVTVINNY